jgi:hypothetical protein
LYLALREEGDKGPRGKSSWQKIKSRRKKPSDASPRDPEKAIKGFLVRKGRDP